MYLGIDLGTSSVKVILMDDKQSVIAFTFAKLTCAHPFPLWSEQNPQDWWNATCLAISQLQQTHSHQLANLKAIGLSGQQHGATLLDKSDRVLRPAILWDDGRAFEQCQQLESIVPQYGEITGNRVMPGFTAPKLRWIQQNEPTVFDQIHKILLPKDYLRLRLTGDYASDLSDSAGTSWLNVGKRIWSDEMLAATGLTQKQMPALFEGSDITGHVTPHLAKQWGIPRNTPVVGGAGDNAASAISVNVIKPGNAFLSLGTSGVYFVANETYAPNPIGGVHTFCHCLPNLWHQMSVHLSASSCLTWLSELLSVNPDVLLHETEATSPNENQLLFLPYLSGERTPHNDPYARGVFFGMTHTTQRTDLVRAVLEGVAFAFADGQAAMLNANPRIDEISVLGGGARNFYWGKILASVLQRPLTYRQERAGGAAMGAARLAWLGINPNDIANIASVFTAPPIEKIIWPDEQLVTLYLEKRKLFQQLYQQLKPLFLGCRALT